MAERMTVAAYLVMWSLTVQRGRTAQWISEGFDDLTVAVVTEALLLLESRAEAVRVPAARSGDPDVWYRTDDGWFVFPGTDTVPPATPKDPFAKERLLSGELRAMVTAFFIEEADRQHTVQQVADEIDHSRAAVGKVIRRLVAEGTLIRAGGRPRRYRIRPGA